MRTIPVTTRLAPSTTTPPLPGIAPASASEPAPAPASPASAPGPASLSLRINSLVLHGFSAVDGRRVGAAFEEELSHLLAAHPVNGYTSAFPDPAGSAAAPDLAPLSAQFAPGRPELTGRRAARALHARLHP